MLHTIPLQSLLDWLSKPKGPNLVEASVAAVPEKALVLAVTKKMLYVEESPLVGVGFVYKLHYVSTVLFSAAYMQLNIWHSASSDKESGGQVDCITPRICEHLQDERCDTCGGTTSHLIGCGIQGGHGGHW